MMSKISIILLTILAIVSIQAQDLPTVAIMNFDESGISETDTANITTRFSYELSRVFTNDYIINFIKDNVK